MKPQMILMSTLALLGATLAGGCSGSSSSSAVSSASGASSSAVGPKKKVGILQFGSFEALEKAKQGFVDVLEKSSIKDSVSIEVKNPAANSADNQSMAATLAADSDLVYGVATPSATALKTAVGSLGFDTPVLFSAVTNAIGAKLVANLEAPEGNCTGVLDLGPIEKELEVLSKFEGVKKVTSFFTSTEVNSVYQAEIAEAWMDKAGIEHTRTTITNASEISSALAGIGSDVDAIFLPTDDTIANNMSQVKQANDNRVDKLIIVGSDTGMINGCTFALGVDYYQCGVQAGEMAVKILGEGKAIKDIPVETCDTNSIFINKTWSESLGITIPESVLSIEGAVIQ
ncbi:MAG: ABC transporter substrate-binding protein [Bacilli bacterium]|nr:ABC transporter substrate-binding protein [Bacilli bacterium]